MNGENTLSRRQFGAMLTAAPLAAQALATERLEPHGSTG